MIVNKHAHNIDIFMKKVQLDKSKCVNETKSVDRSNCQRY